jgi:hypothetical protein
MSYKILLTILSRLTPYSDEITGGHQCECRRNRSVIDQIFLYPGDNGEKREYNGTVHQLFINFKKAYESVRREVLYNILVEFGIPRKLAGLIKMCINETYSTGRIGKYQTDKFPIHNGLKERDALSQLLFNFGLEYAIRRVHENHEGLKLNETHQLLAYANDADKVKENMDMLKTNTESFIGC